jgi:hypothetical protein
MDNVQKHNNCINIHVNVFSIQSLISLQVTTSSQILSCMWEMTSKSLLCPHILMPCFL